jgi:hypothetical protein
MTNDLLLNRLKLNTERHPDKQAVGKSPTDAISLALDVCRLAFLI